MSTLKASGKTEQAGVAKADVVCELSKMMNCDLVNQQQQLLVKTLKVKPWQPCLLSSGTRGVKGSAFQGNLNLSFH